MESVPSKEHGKKRASEIRRMTGNTTARRTGQVNNKVFPKKAEGE